MPKQFFYRQWCIQCQDYTLFIYPFNPQINVDSPSCNQCGTSFQEHKLSEVPSEKQELQRSRYKEMKASKFNKRLRTYLTMGNDAYSSFERAESEIIECDAGQDGIDNLKTKQYNDAKRIIESERLDAQKYKHLGRNELCLCNSGLKYKKCCFQKYSKYI